MREQVEGLTLEGTTLRVAVREPLPVDLPTLAVATAIRVLDRYAVLDRVTVTAPATEVSLTRDEVERLLRPEGFAALREWGRWRQVLARAVQAYTGGRPA